MDIEDLILKKEEIPILHDRNFQLPIHPNLLDPNVNLDPSLASKVFEQAMGEWHEDLREYRRASELDGQTKKWLDSVFLSKVPKIKRESGHQIVSGLTWEDQVFTTNNGFATGLSISRNAGGTIYFNKGEDGCRTFVSLRENSSGYVRFPEEKTKEFGFEEITLEDHRQGALIHVYNLHNVDHYPGALFLRNWGMLYLNEALRSVLR